MVYRCLEQFDDYQMQYYEELSHYFVGRLHLLERLKAFLEEAVSYNDFCIRIHARHLPKIISENNIRQLAEVGGGTTLGGIDQRKKVVRQLFNCRLSEMTPADYPIFGYLASSDNGGELICNADMSYQYGGVLMVLKKDNMLSRTTMTYGDSVNMAACSRMVATRVNKILPTCFQSLANANSGNDARFMAPPNGSWFIQNLCMALDDGRLDPHALHKINDVFDGRFGGEFIELQYHGGIQIDRDVEAVYGMPFEDGDEEIFDQAKVQLKELGIKARFFDIFSFHDAE